MNYKLTNSGFSLTEVLIAVGILAVGMIFVAGVFPAGIYLTTVATERTIAAVAADEAFAKVRLIAADPNHLISVTAFEYDKLTSFGAGNEIDPNELEYPSTDTGDPNQYCWSALCRLTEAYNPVTDPNPPVQVTVFVSRKVSQNLEYLKPDGSGIVDWPGPVKVGVSGTGNNELTITGDKTYINDGYTIVDDANGLIYRVLERYKPPNDSIILLDRDWQGGPTGSVWVVPPPVGGGRYPCIAVYQKVIKF